MGRRQRSSFRIVGAAGGLLIQAAALAQAGGGSPAPGADIVIEGRRLPSDDEIQTLPIEVASIACLPEERIAVRRRDGERTCAIAGEVPDGKFDSG